MKAFSTLVAVEFRLSLRDMNMPIFAAIMPVVVMLVIGMLFGGQPAHEGAGYTFVAQSVGAVSAIGICAGGAMGLPLVVSNYRYRKILKRYFVTPVSAGTILAVQVAVYTVYALVSASRPTRKWPACWPACCTSPCCCCRGRRCLTRCCRPPCSARPTCCRSPKA